MKVILEPEEIEYIRDSVEDNGLDNIDRIEISETEMITVLKEEKKQ